MVKLSKTKIDGPAVEGGQPENGEEQQAEANGEEIQEQLEDGEIQVISFLDMLTFELLQNALS
jgi:hypothetical protein